MARRSSGASFETLRMTSAISPLTDAPSGSMPVSRKNSMSFNDQEANPSAWEVMLGTQPFPCKLGPPAKRSDDLIAPNMFRPLWHSAQCPGPSTKYAPRSTDDPPGALKATGFGV